MTSICVGPEKYEVSKAEDLEVLGIPRLKELWTQCGFRDQPPFTDLRLAAMATWFALSDRKERQMAKRVGGAAAAAAEEVKAAPKKLAEVKKKAKPAATTEGTDDTPPEKKARQPRVKADANREIHLNPDRVPYCREGTNRYHIMKLLEESATIGQFYSKLNEAGLTGGRGDIDIALSKNFITLGDTVAEEPKPKKAAKKKAKPVEEPEEEEDEEEDEEDEEEDEEDEEEDEDEEDEE